MPDHRLVNLRLSFLVHQICCLLLLSSTSRICQFNAAAFRTSTDYFDVYNVNSPDEENIILSCTKSCFSWSSGFDSDGSWCPCSGDKYSMTQNEEACMSVRGNWWIGGHLCFRVRVMIWIIAAQVKYHFLMLFSTIHDNNKGLFSTNYSWSE